MPKTAIIGKNGLHGLTNNEKELFKPRRGRPSKELVARRIQAQAKIDAMAKASKGFISRRVTDAEKMDKYAFNVDPKKLTVPSKVISLGHELPPPATIPTTSANTQSKLHTLMYAFGDGEVGDQASVLLMESLVSDFIKKVIEDATDCNKEPGFLAPHDILFALRKDNRMQSRAKYLWECYKDYEKSKDEIKSSDKLDNSNSSITSNASEFKRIAKNTVGGTGAAN